MDTHLPADLTVDHPSAALSVRLPGEPGDPPPDGDGLAPPYMAAPAPGERVPQPRPKRRQGLLPGAAVVALAAACIGGFLVSPYNHIHPMPRMASTVRHLAASAGIQLTPPVAPSASLADVRLPPAPPPVIREHYAAKPKDQQVQEFLSFRAGPQAGTSAGALSRAASDGPPPALDPAGPPRQAGALRPGVGASAASPDSPQPPQGPAARSATTPAAPTGRPGAPAQQPAAPNASSEVPPGYVPSEPGIAPLPVPPATDAAPAVPAPAPLVAEAPQPQPAVPSQRAGGMEPRPSLASAPSPVHDVTGTVLSSLSPPAKPLAEAARSPAPVPPPAPAPAIDPVGIARNLHAAPMTPSDQVQVLNLVTEMATMLRDLRTQDAQLRADFSKSAADTAARLADFERRLALAEARTAVTAARDVAEPALSPPPAVPPAPAPTAPMVLTRVETILPGSAAGPARRYRVQAASPGLAMLAEIDRGGGDGAQLQVAVGDSIPGYGKIKSIAQRGTSWVVTTENGAIQ